MAIWGFWYPPYVYGVRLVFDPAEFLFGAYGLMGCPTTMVALSLLFLVYPSGDRRLFHLLTAYAVFADAAMVALLYVPDIPFFVLGVASLMLIGWVRHRDPVAWLRPPAMLGTTRGRRGDAHAERDG
jgi:hypothetical protein